MLRVAALTSVGRLREVNEDTFTLIDLVAGGVAPEGSLPVSLESNGAVLGVYDGTGQCGPGGSSSHVAAGIIAKRLSTVVLPDETGDLLSRHLLDAVQAAHREVFAINAATRCGSGTTATVVAISSRAASIAHIGDSRAYLFAGGQLIQVTQDDTLVRELLAAGKLTPEEVETFPHRNVITRVLGFMEKTDVPVTSLTLQGGDLLLLCTDGVWGEVGDPAIAAILAAHRDPAGACRALIEAADEAGGHDNQTAAVALFEPG